MQQKGVHNHENSSNNKIVNIWQKYLTLSL